jgi:predicted transposase YdaD
MKRRHQRAMKENEVYGIRKQGRKGGSNKGKAAGKMKQRRSGVDEVLTSVTAHRHMQ